jgi:hypothetical protein
MIRFYLGSLNSKQIQKKINAMMYNLIENNDFK